ncbi:sensor histidine kinase [Yinghuangia soli]|uniref:histidine kinase n=1 Tax=Yinghuangia soli TaxID=2908204 RepID=A0AA41Q193_9ACTN|nr:HAMP domain-containing sensor histidine kinase [Yinghuangia soli]MCF2529100.1 HAMP domain-containing histidine kinase [Yinghuangia soli]
MTTRQYRGAIRGFRPSIRLRIAAAMAAVSCVVAAVLGFLVHETAQRQRLDRGRDIALARLDAALGSYGRTGQVNGPGAAVDDPGLPEALRPLLQRGHQGTVLVAGSNGEVVWAAAPVGDHVVSTRFEHAAAAGAAEDLDSAIVASALFAVAVTVLVGVAAAAGISRRIRHVQQASRRIADGDLDARVGTIGGRDEVSDLAASVDRMAEALQERLQSEQRFTADVAHELRTPLTGLVTAAELLPPSRPTELVHDRVRALQVLVEDLLEVSRLDAAGETAELRAVRLGSAVRRILAAAEAAGAGATRFTPADDAIVQTDERRLDRILTNLVVNAHRHGAPPVEVAVAGRTVTVRDHGPGFPPDLLAHGPQRFRSGHRERGRGTGLGLTIAVGQAKVIGAKLVFGTAAGGGALAVLELPRTAETGPPGGSGAAPEAGRGSAAHAADRPSGADPDPDPPGPQESARS